MKPGVVEAVRAGSVRRGRSSSSAHRSPENSYKHLLVDGGFPHPSSLQASLRDDRVFTEQMCQEQTPTPA